ncbi:hypothetical protein RM844_17325 [Streptomyces sp. DSM 44915]|uniref:Uncharacterized protein n=1 Tax=Streptomyces chisholmiae TaxID=3075540 RepID=A0ABU2JST0_9ACTN|nr:hypothetical protein [Streptomyces sp. DSM 44915]MDT0268045.1 hypothetical protein [Streptomyces sp. DSM 44915]
MSVDPLAHFLRQLSPTNRQWLESQPEDKQRIIAERWQPAEGRGAALLASLDLAPDLVDEGASANAYLEGVRDGEQY